MVDDASVPRRLLAALVPILVGTGVALAHPAPAAAQTTVVQIVPAQNIYTIPQLSCSAINLDNCVFDPSSVTIRVGAAVTWQNDSGSNQTITADDGSFSLPLPMKATTTHSFTRAGTFGYSGRGRLLHGTVTVLPPPTPTPASPPPRAIPAAAAPPAVRPAAAGVAAAPTTPPPSPAASPSPSASPDAQLPDPLLLIPTPSASPPASPAPRSQRVLPMVTTGGRSSGLWLTGLLIFTLAMAIGAVSWRLRQRPLEAPPPHPSQLLGAPRRPVPAADSGGWLEL